jgi:hypothetical protein
MSAVRIVPPLDVIEERPAGGTAVDEPLAHILYYDYYDHSLVKDRIYPLLRPA